MFLPLKRHKRKTSITVHAKLKDSQKAKLKDSPKSSDTVRA
jgi:hypothetical protein